MDFFGDTTAASVLEAIVASVQATGNDVWGVLAFVGVPLAFLIGAFVIDLIKDSSGGKPRRTSGGGYATDQYTPEQSARIVAKIREIEHRPGAGYP